MNFLGEESTTSSSALQHIRDEFLMREIVLTHDPDGRQLDSELLLLVIESTLSLTGAKVSDYLRDAINIDNIDAVESDEPLGCTIFKISQEILCRCFKDETLHAKTMALLEMLTHFRWDAKVILTLAAFTSSYGLFSLIMHSQSDEPLAVALAELKQVSRSTGFSETKFKALTLLVSTMVKATKLIIMLEGLPMKHELLNGEAMTTMKSKIYMSTYWIIRSILKCSSHIADFRTTKTEQVYSHLETVAAWGILSLRKKLNSICDDLETHIDMCYQQIESKLNEELPKVFKEDHVDNLDVLQSLFGLKNEFPLKDCYSQTKNGIVRLKNKVVMLLISKPDLLPVENIFWLVQQTYEHPQHKNLEQNYVILWVPLPSSDVWTREDAISFQFFESSLPWFSIRWPWSLKAKEVDFIKQEWGYKEDPLMVVLDVNGKVTNSNAMDMVWIWGLKAFPFSVSRQKELIERENWTLEFMVNGISPLLNKRVEEGKNLCIFGSKSLDWIREFTDKLEKIKLAGIQIEVVYVGCNDTGENVHNILDIINEDKLCATLTLTKIHFFWFRLQTIRKLLGHHQEHSSGSDKMLNEVSELLEFSNNEKGWAVFGRGSSTNVIKLKAEKLLECSDLLPAWGDKVSALGLVDAIRSAFEPSTASNPCPHQELVAYEKGLMGSTAICSSCKRPMEKFVVYKCDVASKS